MNNTENNQQKQILIIDTNTFINCVDLLSFHQKYEIITSDGVLDEIRDKKAREKYQSLPFEIEPKAYSKTALNFVKKFAISTGDISSLSQTDMELIAVAYTIAEDNKKLDLLRKEPLKPIDFDSIIKINDAKNNFQQENEKEDEENIQRNNDQEQDQQQNKQQDDGWIVVSNNKKKKNNNNNNDYKKKQQFQNQKKEINEIQNDSENSQSQQQQTVQQQKNDVQNQKLEDGWVVVQGNNNFNNKKQQEDQSLQEKELEEQSVLQKIQETENPNIIEAEEEESGDDDKGWINQQNLNRFLQKSKVEEQQENQIGVFMMTSDYAMQNVILQIGIPLLSIDGMVIKKLKRFVLECYTCKKLCKDNTKIFCQNCGNQSLLKVSCSFNDDGTLTLYRKKGGFKVNTKGMVYSIPKYEGGRNSNDLILREDEMYMGGRNYLIKKNKQYKEESFQNNLMQYSDGIHFEDQEFKKKFQPNFVFGQGGINPAARIQKITNSNKKK